MKKAEASKKVVMALDALVGDDPEMDHSDADEHLLRFLETTGSKAVADAYRRARTRIGFWYA